jgi:hypothetical protein
MSIEENPMHQPVRARPVIFNPKLRDKDETALECPECGEPVEAENMNDTYVEYQCGCDELRRFSVG